MRDRLPLCRGQRHIHRMGMATKVAAGFKQGDLCLALQAVRRSQAGNARADDGNLHGALRVVFCAKLAGTGWDRACSTARTRPALSGPVMLE